MMTKDYFDDVLHIYYLGVSRSRS